MAWLCVACALPGESNAPSRLEKSTQPGDPCRYTVDGLTVVRIRPASSVHLSTRSHEDRVDAVRIGSTESKSSFPSQGAEWPGHGPSNLHGQLRSPR